MKTIHLVTSAHLDPIWLWPLSNGVDAVLNTCRTMVRFLDRHPQVIFTCGEAWKYRTVQQLAPALFEQIRKLVDAGRWEIIGGWWIQPDCNAPSGFAIEHQIELGQRYFRETFGQVPDIAYNVDSFGHAATLPGYMTAAGQRHYVMMRPQESELKLPARLFRWQGYEGGPAVTTFRIAGGYGDFNRISEAHIRAALTELPDGIDHTMCFLGVGDHGGGPNERLMAWMEAHKESFSDVNLVWSSPARFFAAIQNDLNMLPIVTGELQHHAVGCYSVYRTAKTALRRAEHALAQAETLATDADRTELDEAWRTTCFHHFHDTLGGTCLPSAYGVVEAQLGGVYAQADTLLNTTLRRRVLEMPADPHHRIVLHNASDRPHSGYAAWEYWWTDGGPWEPHWRFIDEKGSTIPHQSVTTEAVQVGMQSRFLFRADLEPGQTTIIRVDRTQRTALAAAPTSLVATDWRISNTHACIDLTDGHDKLSLWRHNLTIPQLELIADPTDTWSHGIDRFAEQPARHCEWSDPVLAEAGPLMAAVVRRGRIGESPVMADYRLYHGERFAELIFRIEWVQHHQILKLTWPMPAAVVDRVDGIMGGELVRQSDGKERPVRDFTLLRLADGSDLGVVCPDVFAIDVTANRVRFTLLRNPMMAHHDPATSAHNPRGRASDSGQHEFRFRFYAGDDVNTRMLNEHATAWQRPLLMAETTDGMPPI